MIQLARGRYWWTQDHDLHTHNAQFSWIEKTFANSPELCHLAHIINFRKWSEIYWNDMNQWRVIKLKREQIIFMYLISLFGSKLFCIYFLGVIIIWQYYQTPLLLLLMLNLLLVFILLRKPIFCLFFSENQAYSLEFDPKNYCSHAFKKETKTISQIYLETNTTRHLMLLKLLCLYYIISFGLLLKSWTDIVFFTAHRQCHLLAWFVLNSLVL